MNSEGMNEAPTTQAGGLEQVVAYYRAEVERLQSLLRAERVHNGRLMAANAHLKEASGLGWGVLDVVRQDNGDHADVADSTQDRIRLLTDKADALSLPVV